jgi:hypothetical protein
MTAQRHHQFQIDLYHTPKRATEEPAKERFFATKRTVFHLSFRLGEFIEDPLLINRINKVDKSLNRWSWMRMGIWIGVGRNTGRPRFDW